MKVSVAIPAFNEERLIAGTLACVRHCMEEFVRRDWQTELIVCDNNSTDRTAELAQASGATVVFEPVNQISRARNAAAKAATGDWIIFVDADSTPSPELFSDVADQIAGGECLAGGATVRLESDNWLAGRITMLWNAISRSRRWFAGAFIFCSADAFRRVGGFSEELFVSEEIDLSKRLNRLARETGKKVVILHRHPLRTSARKTELYSTREHLRFIWNSLLHGSKLIRSRDECHLWYDGRR